MDKIIAYIDEYGAFGFQMDKPNVSTHFIITAIIVQEKDVQDITSKVENIRKKYFQKGEIKSSKVGRNHSRRKQILDEINQLPFRIFALVVDKKLIFFTKWSKIQTIILQILE